MNTEQEMFVLQSINIERASYGPHEGKMIGKIRFKDGYDNEMTLHVPDDKAREIMILLADCLIKQTQKISGDMTTRIIEAASGKFLTQS